MSPWLYDPRKKEFVQPASDKDEEEFAKTGFVAFFTNPGAKPMYFVIKLREPLERKNELHPSTVPVEGWQAVAEVTGGTGNQRHDGQRLYENFGAFESEYALSRKK